MMDILPVSGELTRKGYSPVTVDRRRVLHIFQSYLDGKEPGYALEEVKNVNEQAILNFLFRTYRQSFQTIETYVFALSHVLDFIALKNGKTCFEVHESDVRGYVHHLQKQRYAPSTINSRIAISQSFWRSLVDAGLLRSNPCTSIHKLREGQSGHAKKVISLYERDQMFAYALKECSARDYLLLLMLYSTGARVGIIPKATWGSLYLDVQGRAWISVEEKGSEERSIYVPATLLRNLQKYREYQFGLPPDAQAPGIATLPIFAQQKSVTTPISRHTAHRVIKHISTEAIGKAISPHWLRHSFATHVRLKGGSLEAIKAQLGHRSYDTTLRYEESVHFQTPAGEVLAEDIPD